jgi:hypothetical protein
VHQSIKVTFMPVIRAVSWRGRLLSKGHTEIECDRKVWLHLTYAQNSALWGIVW